MTLVETAINFRLKGTSELARLVGSRIYPVNAPQSTAYPYVTYRRIAAVHHHSTYGSSGLCDALFQIEAVAQSYESARRCAEAMREALQGFQGMVRGVFIQGVQLERDEDGDDFLEGSEVPLYIASQDYSISYTETKPVFTPGA